MKTIVFASQKGGSSKSMLCRCQAVAARLAGDGPVALLDTDPQGTVANWYRRRGSGDQQIRMLAVSSIEDELDDALAEAQRAGCRYVFIDTQGALTDTLAAVGTRADFILVPMRASVDDIDAMTATYKIVQKLGRPFAFILTQVKPEARINTQARGAIEDFGIMAPVLMGDRVDYAMAITDGRTVLETEPHSRSAGEMMELWDFLKEQTSGAGRKRKARAA